MSPDLVKSNFQNFPAGFSYPRTSVWNGNYAAMFPGTWTNGWIRKDDHGGGHDGPFLPCQLYTRATRQVFAPTRARSSASEGLTTAWAPGGIPIRPIRRPIASRLPPASACQTEATHSLGYVFDHCLPSHDLVAASTRSFQPAPITRTQIDQHRPGCRARAVSTSADCRSSQKGANHAGGRGGLPALGRLQWQSHYFPGAVLFFRHGDQPRQGRARAVLSSAMDAREWREGARPLP